MNSWLYMYVCLCANGLLVTMASWLNISAEVLMVFDLTGSKVQLFLKSHKDWMLRIIRMQRSILLVQNVLQSDFPKHNRKYQLLSEPLNQSIVIPILPVIAGFIKIDLL